MGGLVKNSSWKTSLAVIPVATMAWLVVGGSGVALAAPNDHAAASASDANANGGVGNGNGNGNAKHDDSSSSSATTSASTDTSAPSTDTSTADSHQTSGTAGTSGDPTKPPPNSNADNKGGGANGQCPGGPYCSTRDGSPSGNGNGNGKAVGKPCAGCVGKADNKNPKGQNPNGSDHNAGYECDRNHGIGRTNPAHTGCTPTDTPTCEAPNVLVDGVCGPVTEGCPDGEHMVGGTCLPDDDCVPVATNNNCHPTKPCVAPAHRGANGTCVLGEKHTRKPTHKPTTSVLGTKTTRLPFTGASVGWMTEGGIAAVTMGTLLIAGGRRRRQQV